MKIFFYLYRQSWRKFLIASLLGIVSGLCGTVVVATIGKAMAGGRDLDTLAEVFFGATLVQLLALSMSSMTLLEATQLVVLEMRVALSRKIVATSTRKLQELGKPALLNILTADVATFAMAFALLPAALSHATIVVATLAYLCWLSWQVFVSFAALLAAGLVLYTYAARSTQPFVVALREHMDALTTGFRGLIEGSRELQLNAARATSFIEGNITQAAVNHKNTFTRSMKTYIWLGNGSMVMMYSVIGFLVFVTPRLFPAQAGVLSAATVAILFMMRPVMEMTNIVPSLRQADVALKKIQMLDQGLAKVSRLASPASSGTPFGHPVSLHLEAVCHRYPGPKEENQFMLGPLNLTIAAGDICYIVGGNGCGKSTLAMLLLGLFEPEGGRILLNGQEVTRDNVTHYRALFSAVFSDFHLFEELPGADQDGALARARHYLNEFGMAHKVTIENGKFSTTNLSAGQRRRLALVSAYLEDRPIYLFDEWAADQDPVFKRVFYTQLLPELKRRGKTVLVITHDDAYFSLADRILKIENGKLVQFDTAATDPSPLVGCA